MLPGVLDTIYPIVQGEMYDFLESKMFVFVEFMWIFFGGIIGITILWGIIWTLDIVSGPGVADF